MSVQCSGYQASPSHVGSPSSPTPSSRFAVRYVHGFCLMLPPDTPFLVMPLPCWRRPSVRSRRTIMFPTSSETAACASCQAHINIPVARPRGIRRELTVAALLAACLAFVHTVRQPANFPPHPRSPHNSHRTKTPRPTALSSMPASAETIRVP